MSQYKDGNYKGSAIGHNAEITVGVKIQNGNIENINIIEHHEDPGLGGEAFPKIKEEILKKQTYIVDAISGATNTSNGFKRRSRYHIDINIVIF